MKVNRAAFSARAVLTTAVSLIVSAVSIAGCSGGDSTSPPAGHQDVWSAVASRGWTIAAESEAYKCYGAQVSADDYITGFRLAAPSAAQTELFVFVMDSPPSEGAYDFLACARGAGLDFVRPES